MGELEHKTTFRLPKDLHTRAKIKAVQLNRPLSAIVREFLEKWLEDDTPELDRKEVLTSKKESVGDESEGREE